MLISGVKWSTLYVETLAESHVIQKIGGKNTLQSAN